MPVWIWWQFMTEENGTEFVTEKPLFTSVKLALSMLVCCYNTQKIDLGFFFYPRDRNRFFHIEDFVVSFILCILCRKRWARRLNVQCTEQSIVCCFIPLLARHEVNFLPEWNWFSVLVMHLSFSLTSLLRMALSVDSAFYRWQRRGAQHPSQTLSESTPLLFSVRDKPKFNLNKWRIVVPDNGSQWKDWKQASVFYSGNRIQTTKYTWFTFLPQNLFEQFNR